MSPRTKRILTVAATPFVVVGIYGWMIKVAYADAKHIIARKLWPGPPIDHP